MNQQDTLAVLDTCVLLKPRLSDVLMDMRAERLFSAHWTANIDNEFRRNMQAVYGVQERHAVARLQAMKRRCPGWDVPMSCVDFGMVPNEVDKKDRHVAAAALALRHYSNQQMAEEGSTIACEVYVVTDNVKHLAKKQMAALGVTVVESGAFLNAVYKAQPAESERAVLRVIKDLEHPPYTQAELLWALRAHGAKTMVDQLAMKWRVVPVRKAAAPTMPRRRRAQ